MEVTKLQSVDGYNRENYDGTWTIIINEDLEYPQKRITVAHELYDILTRQPLCDSRSTHPLGGIKPLNEHAAEQFAYELLMPEAPFKKYWEMYNGDIERIAKLIFAPIDAVASRALMLELY